jgi:hypothetical protein
MYRIVFGLTLAFAMIVGVIGNGPTRSLALQASPTPEATPPPEVCAATETDGWEDRIDVQPPGGLDAVVKPLDSPDQYLYLVAWTIPSGTCIPFEALGNQKDGAVVFIVQQGVIEFTAEPFDADSAAAVTWGPASGGSNVLPFGTTQTLNPGDWVTQDDRIWFTLRSVGDESAIVQKAVWAKPPSGREMEGCSGGCK